MLTQLQLTLNRLDVRSIGVSNFGIDDLKELLESAEILPAVNQVRMSTTIFMTLETFTDGARWFHVFGCVMQIALHPYGQQRLFTHPVYL